MLKRTVTPLAASTSGTPKSIATFFGKKNIKIVKNNIVVDERIYLS